MTTATQNPTGHETDKVQKDGIQEALKAIEVCVAELQLLRSYNFNTDFSPGTRAKPAKFRLLDIGHRLVQSSAEIMRCAADLPD
jgi:hypothetical protein